MHNHGVYVSSLNLPDPVQAAKSGYDLAFPNVVVFFGACAGVMLFTLIINSLRNK